MKKKNEQERGITFLDSEVLTNLKRKVHWLRVKGEEQLGWIVQDLADNQDATLFCKGLDIIFTKLDDKIGEFLRVFVSCMRHQIHDEYWLTNSSYVKFIAFVCDVALHDNPNLANQSAYHKDFTKYVENLCKYYHLDEDFELFKKNEKGKLFRRYEKVNTRK